MIYNALNGKAKYIAVGLFVSTVSVFADDAFQVWVPKMLVTEESVDKNQAFNHSKGVNSQNILHSFNNAIKKYYPKATSELDKKNIKNTFAVYLKVSRASVYEEQLPNSSVKSYTLPITASINFLNIFF